MKKILLVFFVQLFVGYTFAQDIEVKTFEPLENDQTATLSPRKDINGVECGLVKVQLKEPGAEFEGSVMGEVQFTGKEYLVYLPNGTKRLGIKHPDYLPTTIVFADYGTKRIASSTTYELKLKTNKKKAIIDDSKKGVAVFNIKPSNAILLIDGQIADGSGGAYALQLPYGTHYYTVKLKDFSINNQQVQIDNNAKNINVDLTEFFAKVDISCKTEDAEILINNEQKGVGRWDGMMIPGKYTIEAQKDGCRPQSRQIELKDNDNVSVNFSALKAISGGLRVDYEPVGSDVLLNGKKVGVTPLVLKDLPVGDYQLEIWKEYYVKEFANVKVREDQEWKERGKLKLTEFGYLFYPGEISDVNSEYPFCLAEYYRTGATSGYRGANYTCERDTFDVPLNPVTGIYWLKKAASLGDKDAIEKLNPFRSMLNDEKRLSFVMAKKDVDETDIELRKVVLYVGLSYAALAWHYFYGIGCEKNKNEAIRLIKLACNDKGYYFFRAFKQLIKEMGLDSKLKYVTEKEYFNY